MLWLLVLVFLTVFAVTALLLVAKGTGASQQTKQTLAVLHATLATSKEEDHNLLVDIRKEELLSTIPWINRWLLKLELTPRLRSLIYQANVQWTAGTVILLSLGCALIPGYLFYLRTGAGIFSMLIGGALGATPFLYLLYKRSQRFNKFEQELPEALDLVVSALRAGNSLVSALGMVANESPDPIGAEFRICYDEQNYGLELRAAMDNLATRVPLQDLRIVIAAILIQKESGGNLAEVLDKVAHVIRERFRLKRQIRVHTAQGRLTGWILSCLPLVLGIALYLVNPKMISLLWERPAGLKLLYTAGTMTVIGALIIRKIVNMDV